MVNDGTLNNFTLSNNATFTNNSSISGIINNTGTINNAGVNMMWNIIGETRYKAADTRLPELSVKPYVQYGAGVQKSWSERFTAYFQTMIRNGGRTGIVLECGFRWTLGKDSAQKTKTSGNNKTVIKS